MNIFDIFPELKNKYSKDELDKRQFELSQLELNNFLNESIKKHDIDKIQYYLKKCDKKEADNLIVRILLEEEFDDWIDLFDSINYHKDLPESCKIAFRLGLKEFFNNADLMNSLEYYKKIAVLDIVFNGNNLHIIKDNFGLNIGHYTIEEIESYNNQFYLGGLSTLYTLNNWKGSINDYVILKFLDIKVLNDIVDNSNKIKIKHKILDF